MRPSACTVTTAIFAHMVAHAAEEAQGIDAVVAHAEDRRRTQPQVPRRHRAQMRKLEAERATRSCSAASATSSKTSRAEPASDAPRRPPVPDRPADPRAPPDDGRVSGAAARSVGAHRLPRRGRPAAPGRADRGRGRRRLPAGRRLRPAAVDVHAGRGAALVAAARLAQSWVDPAMARDIETALGKILSVLPPAARVSAEAIALYAPATRARRRHALALADAARSRAGAPASCTWSIATSAARERAHRAAAGLLLLGQGLDAFGLVRTARRLPRLPGRPHRQARGAGRTLSRRAGQDAGGLDAQGLQSGSQTSDAPSIRNRSI